MNLFLDEQFFKKHFDQEVRLRGTFLINLITQLQLELLMHTWASTPTIQGGETRMDDLNLRAVLYAIDRHGGNKTEAANWLGLCRESMYIALRKWNITKAKIVYEEIAPNLIADCPDPADGLPDNTNSSSRKRAGRINKSQGLSERINQPS